MAKDSVHIEEEKHLDKTLEILKVARNDLGATLEEIGDENLSKLSKMREETETGIDFFLFLEQLHQKNLAFNLKDKFKKLDELEYLLKEPYFSRLDLDDPKNDRKDTLYIGKFGHTKGDLPIIIDWRAKIASIYYRYRYPQKNVQYETPEGVETRDLTLKRTFEIDNGALIKYYNNDIQLDENEIIIDKIEQRTGGVLEDIVETIQESQLDIIEADPRQVCVVQGCVGSGKSTVAIHKLSHIFFNYPKLIHPERSILVAKNQVLVGYLSTLFPKLGIFDISYGTVRDVVYRLVFVENMPIEIDLDQALDLSGFSVEDIRFIESKIENVHEAYENLLEDIFENEDFVSFGGFKYSSNQSVLENIEEVISEMKEELDSQKEYFEESSNPSLQARAQLNIKTLKKILRKVKKLGTRLRGNTLPNLCKELGLLCEKKFGYSQAIVYSLIYVELIGLRKFTKFEYCVVDEGQDFNVLEYYFLNKMVLNGRFCILGDLNQNYKTEGINNWEQITDVIPGAKNANTFSLDTNYRSTRPIINFANNILKPYTETYLPKSINRKGPKPEVHILDDEKDLFEKLREDLKRDIVNIDKSIGIICANSDFFAKIERIIKTLKLSEDKFIKIDSKKRITYIPRGIYLMDFEDCKGLEFSKVYTVGINVNGIQNFNEAKKAFVAVTRAMNELSIYVKKN